MDYSPYKHSAGDFLSTNQKYKLSLDVTAMYEYVGACADAVSKNSSLSTAEIPSKHDDQSSTALILPWKHRSQNHHVYQKITPHKNTLKSIAQLQELIAQKRRQQDELDRNFVEHTPIQLVIYLDRHFEREASKVFSEGVKCEKSLSVSGLLNDHIIPRDARLCVQAYVTTSNQYGAKCWSEGGITSISIHDIIKTHQESQNANKRTFIKSSLHIHTTADNMLKGKIGFIINKLSFKKIDSSSIHKSGYNIQFSKMTKTMNTKANREHIMNVIGGYLQRYSKEQAYFNDNYVHGTDKIKCPLDPSEITVSDSQICLPFSTYLMYETPKVSTGYWYNALEILSNREGFENSREFSNYFFSKTTPLKKQASLAMSLVCQYTHLMEYLSDRTANKDGVKINIEMFGDALATLAGDCEDEGLSIGQMFDAFTQNNTQFKRKLYHKYYTPHNSNILVEMQQILNQYVPFLCIEGVTTSHVQNQHTITTRSVTGAHAAIKAIPKDYLAECIARWNPQHPIIENLIVDPKYSRAQHKHVGSILPVLIGEGTGMLNPGGDPDPSPKARSTVYHCRALQVCKKPLMPPIGTSPFYVAILFGATNRFLLSNRIGSFHFCKKIKNQQQQGSNNRGNQYTYGVLFKDLILKDPNLMIIPYGFTNKTVMKNGFPCEFTQEEISVMHHVSKTRVPPMPIYSPQEGPKHLLSQNDINANVLSVDYSTIHPILDNIESNVSNMFYSHRINYKGNYNEYKKRLCKIHVYTTDIHITSQFGQHVINYIKQRKNTIKGFQYALERHSDQVDYWRLTFECTN